jgi:hypothetical protein
MPSLAYRFEFDDGVPLAEAEMTLHVAIAAVEGLYGQAKVRMDVAYRVKEDVRQILVDASTSAGGSLAEVFTSLAMREFGEDAVTVRRAALVRRSEKRVCRRRERQQQRRSRKSQGVTK